MGKKTLIGHESKASICHGLKGTHRTCVKSSNIFLEEVFGYAKG